MGSKTPKTPARAVDPTSMTPGEAAASSDKKQQFVPVSPGWHAARIVDKIWLGLQPGFQGKPPEDQAIVVFLTNEDQVDDDGKVTGKRFVQHRFNPRKWFGGDSSRGRQPAKQMTMVRGISGNPALSEKMLTDAGFTLERLIGRPCRILVGNRESAAGRLYAFVQQFAPPEVGPNGKVEGGPTDREAPSVDLYTRPKGLQDKAFDPNREAQAAADNADVLTPAGTQAAIPEGPPPETPGIDADAAAVVPPDAADGDDVPF